MSGTQARWSELDRLLDQALDLPAEARDGWLAAQQLEPDLRAVLAQALAAAEAPGALDELKQSLAATPVEQSAWIGRQLGPYRIERLLGEGGSASVFLAVREQGGFRQRVALKVLRHGIYRSDDQARFARERRILAALEHPHIARLIDGGLTDAGVPYIAMEYVDGAPITQYCDALHLGVPQRVALAIDVCAAAAHAQRSLVVHRDLKPSNILVGAESGLKLLDFGIAKLLADHDDERTSTEWRRLTPDYAAPEQFAGGAITTATDVYALGVLLYVLLTGAKPKTGANELAVPPSTAARGENEAARAQARATTPGVLARKLRGDLDTIVQTALAPEPARRYADAASLGADLQRWLDGQPIAARPSSFAYRARKLVARHPLGVPASALAALLLVAATGFGIWQARRAAAAAHEALAAAAESKRESERADTAKNFLAQLFQQAAPGEPTPLKDVDALLQRGADMATEQFAANPPVAAELLVTIGDAQRQREHFDAARATLQRAFAAAAKADHGSGASTFRAQLLQADIAFDTGAFVEGKPALQAALAAYRATPAPRTAYIADALYIIGAMDVRLALHAEAVTALEEARTLAQTDREMDLLPEVLSMLGDAYNASGRLDQALAITDDLLRRDERVHGPEHETVAYDLENKSKILSNLARFDEAETAARRAIALHTTSRANANSDDVVQVKNNLAAMLLLEGRVDEAQVLLREVRDAIVATHGEDNPSHLTMLGNLGWAQVLAGDVVQGRDAIQRIVTGLRERVGADSPQTAASERNLAMATWWSGDAHGAQAIFEHALAVDAKPGGSARAAARDRIGLAKLALARGDAQAALALAQAGHHVLAGEFPARHPFVLDAALTLAEALVATGDRSARKQLGAARDTATTATPPSYLQRARALLDLADLDQVAGDKAAARANCDAARAALDTSPSAHGSEARRLRQRLGD